MRVMIDTNILISAALSSSGTPFKAFVKAVMVPNRGLVCDQNIDEMRRIFNRKFPSKISALEQFLSVALLTLEIVPTPIEEIAEEQKIRDVMDRPILRAAIHANADAERQAEICCVLLNRYPICVAEQFDSMEGSK